MYSVHIARVSASSSLTAAHWLASAPSEFMSAGAVCSCRLYSLSLVPLYREHVDSVPTLPPLTVKSMLTSSISQFRSAGAVCSCRMDSLSLVQTMSLFPRNVGAVLFTPTNRKMRRIRTTTRSKAADTALQPREVGPELFATTKTKTFGITTPSGAIHKTKSCQ